MRFGVLGPLSVRDASGRAVTVPEAKVRLLLGCLLAREGRPVPTDLLIDALWGDRPPARAANALQVKVSALRRVLGRERVLLRAPGYLLAVEEGESDAARFRALVARGARVPDARERATLLAEGLGLWRGDDAYADVADHPLVREEAGRLAEERLAALEDHAEARLVTAEPGACATLAAELAPLVAAHPLRERLRATHLRALYGAGRQAEALASYENLRAHLAEDLGADPSPGLTALHTAILRQELPHPDRNRPAALPPTGRDAGRPATPPTTGQDPDRPTTPPTTGQDPDRPATPPTTSPDTGLPATTPTTGPDAGRPTTPPTTSPDPGLPGEPPIAGAGPARGAAAREPGALPPGRAPVPLTHLVGRHDEVRELRGLLVGARLVTLTGTGGVGKTRLAQEVAGGGWFVELGAVRGGADADELAEAVAGALGIRDDTAATLPRLGSPGDGTQRLAAALRDRPGLLVLDNCEHVVDAVAVLAGGLLRTVPGLRILATGREPLGVPGEHVRPIEPLPPADAVCLFAERAAAASPAFALTEDNRAEVAEICARLDGIPLALELAATRVRALGTRELAVRLGDRFRILTTGRRGVPPRQQTLRAVVDWSWELLSAAERIVLCRLSVHRDGCTLDAAEAVCGDDGLDVVDLLGRLVDRSLVVRDGERYRMLESITAYAKERLHESGDEAAASDRHRAYYLALAERAAPLLRGAGQREWLRRLDAEGANLRAAFDAWPSASAPERFAVALSWYWLLSGRLREGRRRLARAGDGAEVRCLEAGFALLCGEKADTESLPYGAVADPEARARARWLVAYGHFNTGELAESERILDGVDGLGDAGPWVGAAVHTLRAAHALLRGDLVAQGRHGREGRALFRALGDVWGQSQSVSPLAALAQIDGDYAEAARLHEDGLRLAEELGLAAERSARLSGLGRLALLAGDWERAAALHERARRGAAEHGYKFGEVYAEMGLALGARRAGRLDEAERLLLGIRDWYQEVSSEAGNHLVLVELGFVAELRGDAETARAWHLQALAAARATRDPRARALALEGLAGAEAAAGRPGRARSLLATATALRERAGAPLPTAERADVTRIASAASRH
ncbi:BTAD domain-containing putative transcriptional regulator [Streptomyces sp. NPDC056222]|uniref:AfsR/SARP family transcriptional regulator n=1 Tax=Streptomyces sp. NPDC056222 TaxID=3345749 RepID=UPI0035D99C2A